MNRIKISIKDARLEEIVEDLRSCLPLFKIRKNFNIMVDPKIKNKLGEETFIIKSKTDEILITGTDNLGAIYGVAWIEDCLKAKGRGLGCSQQSGLYSTNIYW